MLSRKSKDKSLKEGVVGRYVKKNTPSEIPGKLNDSLLSLLDSS